MRRKGNTRDDKKIIFAQDLSIHQAKDPSTEIPIDCWSLIKHNNQPWVGIWDVEEEDPVEARVEVEAVEELAIRPE